MPEFDLATGVVRFKGDLDQFEADIQKAQKKAAKLNETLNSTAGQQRFSMALTTARSLNAEMEKYGRIAKSLTPRQMVLNENRQNRDEMWLARQERREKREAFMEQNRAFARIAANERALEKEQRENRRELARADKEKEKSERLQQYFKSQQAKDEKRHLDEVKRKQDELKEKRKQALGAATTLGAAGVGVGAGALAMGSQASPLAGDTLEKSFKLFTVTVGQTFIPLVKDMSFALQDAAKWWKTLDTGLKETIASTTKFVAIAGAATLAFGTLGKALLFISKNPLIVGAGVAVGAAMTLDGGDAEGGAKDDLAKRRAGRKWFEFDNPRNPWGNTAEDEKRFNLGKVDSKDKEAKKRGDLGIAGPASFTQAGELLRSIQQAAMGTSELDAKIIAQQTLENIKVIADNTKPRQGAVVQ